MLIFGHYMCPRANCVCRHGFSPVIEEWRKALSKGELDCISAGHKDTDLWIGARLVNMLMRSSIDRWSGLRDRPRLRRTPIRPLRNRQVAWTNEKADEAA